MPRKPKAHEGSQPAFPVPPSFLGFTKNEVAATIITAGIFGGPYGQVIMDSTDEHKLDEVADVALTMFDRVLKRIDARGAQ